ncbi:T5orf172 domain-containing protein [Aspergillus similis]
MNSSTNADGRRTVSRARDSTTSKSLRNALPSLNAVTSDSPESPSILLNQGQHIRTEEETRKDIPDLKVRLNCDQAKCGSLRKGTGKPCKVSLRKDDIEAADTMIESLKHLTQSSPNLVDQLFNLARIVHCSHHANSVLMQQRVNNWITAFPTGDDKTVPVMSIAKKIENILWDGASTYCIGKTKKGSRCRWKIGGQKVQNYQRTIYEIVKPDTYLDDFELDYFLQVLRYNSFCFYHKSDQGAEQVKKWKLIITNLRSESVIPSADSNVSRLGQQANTTNLDMDTSSSNVVRRRSKSLSPDQFWPEKHDTSAFEIVIKPIDTDDDKPRALLEETDQTKGYVYAYEVEGNKGLVKIGFTSKTIEERHNEWTLDCNRLVLPIYPPDPRAAVAVPNAARVEALCHAELRQRNVRIYCNACLKQHVEWFRVSPAEAIELIHKWSNWMWMQPLPYQPGLDLDPNTCAEVKEEKHAFDAKQPVERIPAAA